MTAPAQVEPTTTEQEHLAPPVGFDEDLEHLVCVQCHPAEDIALCSTVVGHKRVCEDWLCNHLQCVVCTDLERSHPCL
jgi:hypothetical protein